jgi:N-acetylglucosamine kinase-like BadF-type ATPase
MRIFAGIDGGGTRTRLALADEEGMLIGYAEGDSCSFIDLGQEAARAELARVWSSGWGAAGAPPRPVDALFMGLGSVLSEADARTNCEMAVQLGLGEPGNVRADNDAWNAHAGGLGGQSGILLISGTGSACLGRGQSGSTWRAGGWGYLLNDIGSAYALGHDALIAATRDVDARGKPTSLTPLIRETLGLGNIKEIFRKIHHDGVPRSEIAALAPKVVARAEAGDAVSKDILRRNAKGLAEMTVTVARKLALEGPRIALTGGLITKAHSFRSMFLDELDSELPGFSLEKQGLDPVFGAVLLAREHSIGTSASSSFLHNLRASSAKWISA